MPKSSVSAAKSEQFIESVTRLQPRLAAFDCDGTLWSGDAGESFFGWEFQQGLVDRKTAEWAKARYADYKAGLVDEDTMCGEMVTLHQGLSDALLADVAQRFFDQQMKAHIFPVMKELVDRLRHQGCEVWAVSSSNQWVVRAGARHFGIPPEKTLSAEVFVHEGVISDRLLRVPSGPGKPEAIRAVVKRTPDATFGNSRWDVDMLAMARHAFAINPNADLEELARERGWTIFFPQGAKV
jgi:HAD superfamily phosphoserine phosphatase-like hydrolase